MFLMIPVLSSQVVSLLGGQWGNIALETEVAISAGALLVFASNTAIIGSDYVFMALSRMQFFPAMLLRRNNLRGTPHFGIILATVTPMIPLVLVGGNISLLGDIYAFGLLAAFTLTCIGLDIVRHRERKAAKLVRDQRRARSEDFEIGVDPLFRAAETTNAINVGEEHSTFFCRVFTNN